MTGVAKAHQNEKAAPDTQTATDALASGAKTPSVKILTQWSRIHPENLTGLELVKKFPAFYGTWRFITVFTSARQLPLSWATAIQFVPPHPTYLEICFNIILPSTPRFYKWSRSFSHFIANLKPLFHWCCTKGSVRVCHLVNCSVASEVFTMRIVTISPNPQAVDNRNLSVQNHYQTIVNLRCTPLRIC